MMQAMYMLPQFLYIVKSLLIDMMLQFRLNIPRFIVRFNAILKHL